MFNQTASVTRDRNIKEEKLKAQEALVKLADEEATIYNANLQASRHQLRSQINEQYSVDARQYAEAADARVSWSRKEQLGTLVEKLNATKAQLRFHQEARERELAFKSSIRQKRAAFQKRLARLEQRQTTERMELKQSQTRLANTVNQIGEIELKSIIDKNKARRMKKDKEVMAQQVYMRQQKESEFLRELQLCKARHMAELNELEVTNMEEIEEIQASQRVEEFQILAKQSQVEADIAKSFEAEKGKLVAAQLADKQQIVKLSIGRAQKKLAANAAKAERVASRNREKILLADFPIIKGVPKGEESLKDDESASDSLSQSEGQSEISSVSGSMASLNQGEGDEDEIRAAQKKELEKNSAANKETQVLTEAEREIMALAEAGNERRRNTTVHHKKVLSELRHQQRSFLSQKMREHRRKTADLIKEHEEEIETIKMEQSATMKELMDTHFQSEQTRADTAMSQNLLGMMLPGHIMEKIEMGVIPEPETFNCVTIFFTDIYDFKKLTGTIPPVKILELLNSLYTKFDEIIAKFPSLYKVESVSDTYMVAAGLSANSDSNAQDVTQSTAQALECAKQLQLLVLGMDFEDIVGPHPIKLRIGVHSGAINAGLIGTKMSRYCLFGDTVNTASRMCTTGEAGKVQVSTASIGALGDDEGFEFGVRGEVEVKGKGKMKTYWLLLN
ncbi:adenylate and guanylate cyclase catalytic domain-containing protein [Chytriomyces sp. MP71]|nr:adenylate and guanylate cyclase catalytic domain-containing protein [Chytriomyces sp. MP71]